MEVTKHTPEVLKISNIKGIVKLLQTKDYLKKYTILQGKKSTAG